MKNLPPHRIRHSQRAKRLSLLVRRGYIEIVLPRGVSQRQGLAFLQKQQGWAIRQLAKFAVENDKSADRLPASLWLAAIDQHYQVEFQASEYDRPVLKAEEDRLILLGQIPSLLHFQDRLALWVQQQAHQYLTPWLDQLSHACELPYSEVSYRWQQGRWGSCSSEKKISLNAKLLFLSKELVDYVMIHELCHTVHMNHSSRFWRLVAQHCPSYLQDKRRLQQEEKSLPPWLWNTN